MHDLVRVLPEKSIAALRRGDCFCELARTVLSDCARAREHQDCGIILHCPRCIRTLQNWYWVVRARVNGKWWLYAVLLLLVASLAVAHFAFRTASRAPKCRKLAILVGLGVQCKSFVSDIYP